MTPPTPSSRPDGDRIVLAVATLFGLALVWGPTAKVLADRESELRERAQKELTLEIESVRAELERVFSGADALLAHR
jgi:C4-dicarboxylate-specific signal transduction histidine kinase